LVHALFTCVTRDRFEKLEAEVDVSARQHRALLFHS
jgi:hypothetical protein